jgi:hypothetical protein
MRQLRAGVRAYYAYVDAHRDAFRVLFREMGDPGGELAIQRHRLSKRVASALELIMLAAEAPAPQTSVTVPLAEAWIGAARSLADWWLDHPEMSAEAMADLLTGFGLVGIWGIGRPDGGLAARDAESR